MAIYSKITTEQFRRLRKCNIHRLDRFPSGDRLIFNTCSENVGSNHALINIKSKEFVVNDGESWRETKRGRSRKGKEEERGVMRWGGG